MTYLYHTMRKYGIENFEIKQIDSANSFKHCVFLEGFYIKYYNAIDPNYGYNLTIDGYGDGKEFVSDETRKMIGLNSHIKSRNRSHGVSWDKKRNKWCFNMFYNGKNVSKRFENKEDAETARDIASIFQYGEKAVLIHPDKKEEYLNMNITEYLDKICVIRKPKSKYLEVLHDGSAFNARATAGKGNRVFLGRYNTEEEAAVVRDKVTYYLHGEDAVMNFPNLVSKDSYISEGKEIYEKRTNPNKPLFRRKGKTSVFNGVNKRSPKTWEMILTFNGNRIREIHLDEVSAARAHDYHCRVNSVNLNRLNFPSEEIIEKPVDYIPKKRNKY